MEQAFINILKKLVKEQGNAALTDAKKCKAFLSDYTKNEYKKECRLILIAVEAGMAKAIDGADDLAACKKAMIRDLEEDHDLKPETATDIVNTLALVLRGDTTVTASAQQTAAPESAAAAQELRKKGHDAEKRKDYAEAFSCWTEAAEMGDADSCFQMGFWYMFRFDYPEFTRAVDYEKAEEWFNKAIAAAGSDKDTLKAAKDMLKEVNKAQGKRGLFGRKR
jgi:TPR repeat protein